MTHITLKLEIRKENKRDMMTMIPRIKLEKLDLSKIICGTNQFVGITHRNNYFDIKHHRKYYKDASTIAKFLIYLIQEHGINCMVSSPRDKLYEAKTIAEKETGEKFHWLCTPSIRKTIEGVGCDIFEQIEWCADHDVSVCMPHRMYTDLVIDRDALVIGGTGVESLPSASKTVAKIISMGLHIFDRRVPKEKILGMWQIPYPDIAAKVRDRGMIPGLSTHFVESIQAVEKNGYDAPLIIQPLNLKGYQSNTKPDDLIEAIQNTKLQILNIKPMAAGRIKPRDAFKYCLNNIKKNDFMAFGFGTSFEYMVSDMKIIQEILDAQGIN